MYFNFSPVPFFLYFSFFSVVSRIPLTLVHIFFTTEMILFAKVSDPGWDQPDPDPGWD